MKGFDRISTHSSSRSVFALHGWIGFILIATFWINNWGFEGTRTAWAFFPLWLGYSLTVDAITLSVRGTSLLTRDWRKYIGLFLISIPTWWLFELLNIPLDNWFYRGSEAFSPLEFFILASINFSVVMPAVLGTAELVSGAAFIRRMKPGPLLRPTRFTTLFFFSLGWLMVALIWLAPRYGFPFIWLSVTFILEPVNVWLGNRSLSEWTCNRDWRPVISLALGALVTGFFWEFWNYYSFPKWTYDVPGLNIIHIFEMPLPGYTGYLPFALELYAVYHLAAGLLGQKRTEYIHLEG